uniref:Putative F-box and associated interaction domains-containing protein n=1 Tax=Davidia involucrata TaxID=16924 RepID=A0A5B7BE58_DAVIN
MGNSWREIDVLVPALMGLILGSNTFINGVCNWFSFDDEGNLILSFDLGDEVFRTTRLPDRYREKHNVKLAVLNGSLALILFPLEGTKDWLHVWVMDHRSWKKEGV